MPRQRSQAVGIAAVAVTLLALAVSGCGHTVVRGPDSCDIADKSDSAFDGGNVSGYFDDRGVSFGIMQPTTHLGLAKSDGTTALNLGWGDFGATDTVVPKGSTVSIALADGSQFQAPIHSDAPASSDVVGDQIHTYWTAGATLTNEQLLAMTNAPVTEFRVASDAQTFTTKKVDDDLGAQVQTLANCLAHHVK